MSTALDHYVEAEDSNGCKSARIPVYIGEAAPPTIVSITPSATLCAGANVTFTASVQGMPSFTYLWTVDNGTIVGDSDNLSVVVTLPADGEVFVVTLTVTDYQAVACTNSEDYEGTAVECCVGDLCVSQEIELPMKDGVRYSSITDGTINCTLPTTNLLTLTNTCDAGMVTTRADRIANFIAALKADLASSSCFPTCDWDSSFDITAVDNCDIDPTNKSITLTFENSPITFVSLHGFGGVLYNGGLGDDILFDPCTGGGTGGTGGTA